MPGLVPFVTPGQSFLPDSLPRGDQGSTPTAVPLPFPCTNVIDGFNRANGNLTVGGVYGTDPQGQGFATARVVSNQLQSDVGGVSSNWYQSKTFADDQEAWITVVSGQVGSPQVYLLLRFANPGDLAVASGYGILFDTTLGTLQFTRFDPGVGDTAFDSGSQTVADGGKVGARMYGSTLEAWYCPPGGAWTLVKSVTDTTYPSGPYMGLTITDTNTVVDEWGGGSVVYASTPVYTQPTQPVQFPSTPILDDFNRANTGPPPGPGWTSGITGAGANEHGWILQLNEFRPQGSYSLPQVASAYWTSSFSSSDQEIYFTEVWDPAFANHELWLRVTNPGTTGVTAYVCTFFHNGGVIQKYVSSTWTDLAQPFSLPALANLPTGMGVRVVGNVITVYVRLPNYSWVPVSTATDSSLTTGTHIGVIGYDNNLSYDDFGGGNYVPAVSGGPTLLSVSGTITPAGALIRRTSDFYAGTITPAGALTRRTSDSYAGTITPAGALTRQTRKPIAGTVTSTGALTMQNIFIRAFSGLVTPAGALIRRTSDFYAGTITPAGAQARQTRKTLTGTITPAGVLTTLKLTLLALAGLITPAGALIRRTSKTPTGTVTPAGTETRLTGKLLAGTITPAGTLNAIKTILRSFSGAITPIGTLARSTLKPISGQITPSGAESRRIGKLLSGSITPIGSLSRLMSRLLTGAITPAGQETRRTTKTMTGTIAPTASSTYFHNAVLFMSGLLSPAGALAKRMPKAFGGTLTPTGNLNALRTILIAFAGQITPAATLIRSTLKTFTGQVAPSGTLARRTGKILAGTITPAATLQRSIAKTLTGLITPVGALNAIKTILRSFAGTITPTGTETLRTSKPLTGSIAPAGTETRQTRKTITATITPTGALLTLRAVLVNFAGLITPVGAETRRIGKVMTGVISPTGASTWQTKRTLLGSVTPAGVVTRSTLKRFLATITPAGSDTVRISLFARAFAGTITPASTQTRRIGKLLSGSLAPAGSPAKRITHSFAGLLGLAGTLVAEGQVPQLFGTASGGVGIVWDAFVSITKIGIGYDVQVQSGTGGVQGDETEGGVAASSGASGSVQ